MSDEEKAIYYAGKFANNMEIDDGLKSFLEYITDVLTISYQHSIESGLDDFESATIARNTVVSLMQYWDLVNEEQDDE